MRLLYPSDPFNQKLPDEAYAEEFVAAIQAGFDCSLFSAEDFQGGTFKPRPSFAAGDKVIYRGWMLQPTEYGRLVEDVSSQGACMVTSLAQYLHCHHLPEWYALCAEVTPKTIFVAPDGDFLSAALKTGWHAYFVKDYVKSLTTSRGSVAKSANEIQEIVLLIEKFRGQIEGGVCIREFEDLLPDSEERYFVFKRRAFSRDDLVPPIVQRICEKIDSPFYSVDIARTVDGVPRLIELGDGQVSDRKKWTAAQFTAIFQAA
jgi:hypothetical protein